MEFLKYLGIGILLLVDIVIIVSVLLSSPKSSGMSGLVSGGAETFFGKNKGSDLESQITKVLKIAGIVFVVLSILLATLINRAGL
ncbi:MAG: preprotein translocase subunit SecG [Clostridia bacterium]|nr:preprotein translocase subunit SecG [Clostridia bacterium]